MSARVFIPKNVRAALALLSPAQRVEVETHLENLALAAATDGFHHAFGRFPELDGRRVSEPLPGVRLHLTVDPNTHVLYLHRVDCG